ncbi:low molecular weight phosphotyrosine protein phosphatase [Porticoccaceae bacterium]|jgi:protein-tyrosine phosphatase|nr:low molecular weight phosphotyrosine protein phosphatase [Porticoccaceae bacterium]
MAKISVLFVCLGNICRSPTAHAVFQSMVDKQGLADQIFVDSCGTGDWHIGRAPDPRSQEHALARGYQMDNLRARLVDDSDFDKFDYILVMDKQNLADVQSMNCQGFTGKLGLFLDFCRNPNYTDYLEVPDPYYGGDQGFSLVLDLIEDASTELLRQIKERL